MSKITRLISHSRKWIRYNVEAHDRSALKLLRSVDLSGYTVRPCSLAQFLDQIGPIDTGKVFEDANLVMDGNYAILRFPPFWTGHDINWNFDYIHNYMYPTRYHKKLRVASIRRHSDVKNVWELSRFHAGVVLGQAFIHSQNPGYASIAVNMLSSWIEQNPYDHSVNWKTSMEVAIRACNWITTYAGLQEYLITKPEFQSGFLQALYGHGIHIFRNLEVGRFPNNHYLSNLVGLIWLGLFFKDIPLGPHCNWLEFGYQTLIMELRRQVNPDGTDYEAATAYHVLVAEMLVYTIAFMRAMKFTVPEDLLTTTKAMISFCLDLQKPNRDIPLIGDNDSGRFLCPEGLTTSRIEHLEHVIHVSKKLLEFSDREINAHGYYPDGGYYVLRNSRVYVLVRCGAIGTLGQGGHSHNDQLSLEINLEGQDFVIDPGLYTYTLVPELRNLHRSTQAHSVVYPEGYEQNHFFAEELFRLRESHGGICLERNATRFRGRFAGYRDKIGLIHERVVEIESNGLIIRDRIERAGAQVPMHSLLVLAPEVEVISDSHGTELRNGAIHAQLTTSHDVSLHIRDILVSRDYGAKFMSKQLVFSDIPNDFSISIRFSPRG